MIFQLRMMESDLFFQIILSLFYFNRLSTIRLYLKKKTYLVFVSDRNLNDDVINFVLTTLRNCLIGLAVESAKEIEKHNGCMIFISSLVHRRSDKQMNFLADCLLRLAMFNRNAQVKERKRFGFSYQFMINFLFRFIYNQVNYFFKN